MACEPGQPPLLPPQQAGSLRSLRQCRLAVCLLVILIQLLPRHAVAAPAAVPAKAAAELRLRLRLRLLLCLLRWLVAGDADPSLQEVSCAAALGMEMQSV